MCNRGYTIIPQTKTHTNVGLQVFQYLEQSSVLAKYRFDINSLLNKGMSLKLWWRSIIWFTSFSKYSFPEWNFSDRYLIIYSLSDFFFGHLVISSNSFTNWCISKSTHQPTNKKPIYIRQKVLHTSITPVLYLNTIYIPQPPHTTPKNEVSIWAFIIMQMSTHLMEVGEEEGGWKNGLVF